MDEIQHGVRGPETTHVRFVVPVTVREKLDAEASRRRMSFSQLMREIISKHLRKKKKKKARS